MSGKRRPPAQRQGQDRVARRDGLDDREHLVVELRLLRERIQQRDVRGDARGGVGDGPLAKCLEGRRQRDDEDEGGLGRWSQRRGHSAASTSRTLRLPVRTTQNRPCSGSGSGAAGSVIRSLFT